MTTFGLTIVVSHYDMGEKITNTNFCEQTDATETRSQKTLYMQLAFFTFSGVFYHLLCVNI